MRILKIILILITIFLLFFMSLALIFLKDVFGNKSGYIIALLFVVLGFLLSAFTLIYHIKSFRYYRKSKPYKEANKTIAVLKICAIAHSVYCILFGILSIIGNFTTNDRSDDIISAVVFVPVILFGILSIYETVFLRKQINQLQKEQETKDEIATIGN
ncbi:hypothetical protein [uncultured Kordia sp.]|uniref:hypothetical protein n=1 Tax=uncultured Kordia sp. TaxID=507699 RepID=UPI002612A372|nr:hypothetical protein [uncultured Kordia sp.]